jgi:hypothetical protein
MKSLTKLTLTLAIFIAVGAASIRPAAAGVSFDFFFSSLSPHGSWVVSGSHGHVWRPSVYHSGWHPYHHGHWQYTNVGWSWASDYGWGYIPYHYGTWVFDPLHGWVWVPGYTWAPSWVTFREGPDYIGWAPVAPSFSIGVSFHSGHHYHPSSYVFVPSHHFMASHVHSYVVPHHQTNVIVNKTRIIENNIRVVNNTVVNSGPDVRYVERATRRRIQAIPVERTQSVRELSTRGVSGADLRRVQRDRSGRLRAAEPVSASRPLPSRVDRSAEDRSREGRIDRRTTAGQPQIDRQQIDRQPQVGRQQVERQQADRRQVYSESRARRESRGGNREDAGTLTDRGGPDRSRDPRLRTSPSTQDGGRSRPTVSDTSRQRVDRERSRRPDEGRVFRGVRERQPAPAPRAERTVPDRERVSAERSKGRASRESGREAERKGRSSERQRGSKKDRDRN